MDAAEHFNLPFVQPSAGGKTPEYFKKGVNFAVGGAGVLNNSEFTRMTGINPAQADNSLWVQLQSFNKLLPLIANGSGKPTKTNTTSVGCKYYIDIHICVDFYHDY